MKVENYQNANYQAIKYGRFLFSSVSIPLFPFHSALMSLLQYCSPHSSFFFYIGCFDLSEEFSVPITVSLAKVLLLFISHKGKCSSLDEMFKRKNLLTISNCVQKLFISQVCFSSSFHFYFISYHSIYLVKVPLFFSLSPFIINFSSWYTVSLYRYFICCLLKISRWCYFYYYAISYLPLGMLCRYRPTYFSECYFN